MISSVDLIHFIVELQGGTLYQLYMGLWPYKWATGVISPLRSGVLSPHLITGSWATVAKVELSVGVNEESPAQQLAVGDSWDSDISSRRYTPKD